jgi:eukaryotic-like serine/threonine-protein kinase
LGKIQSSYRVARFEGFELDLRAGELCRAGDKPVSLAEQPFRILTMLLERSGDLLTREEIQGALWPNGTIVEFEHSISAAINRLRQVLGDSAEEPHYIETLARRGYRWRVRVEWVERPAEAAEPTKVEAGAGTQTPFDRGLVGKKVSHYRVLEVLGGGGMGVVYKAEDLKLGRRVALKFLPEEMARDSGALQRFESEARSASALNHPNICTIYGVEEYEGRPLLAMELLEGQTLRDLIVTTAPGNAALELKKLLDLAVQITAGLDAAHRQGIIHRDIKPANIFVSSHGQAKILDFGLAKLFLIGTAAADSPTTDPREGGSPHEPKHETESLTASSPFLSRTGVAMGTAGYMSPEQVRGEKLDARTDLFSFGLVLYEMATGQRAFTGDTAAVLHDAILKQVPAPATKKNPALPAKFEKIIDRALEKDRQARYQSATEMRADLETLKREMEPKPLTRRWKVAAGAVALLLAGATFWFARRQPSSPPTPRELKLRQLTTNSFENRVTSGRISPDGKYLAYSDMKGMYVKLIETGETRALPQPEEFRDRNIGWQCAFWFPDSTGFVTNAHRSGPNPNQWDSHESSVWMASVLGGAPHKLRDNAIAWSVSPDSSLISFGANKGKFGEREIWLMESNGEHAQKLFDADEESSIGGLRWSPDGKRALYVKTDQSGDSLLSRNLKSGPPITLFGPGEMKQVNDLLWLADGRLLYSVAEPGSFFGSACNFWETRLDLSTGTLIAKPRKLTSWSGFCMSGLSETSDGKKLAFLKWVGKLTSILADSAASGTRILQPRHFPLSESSEGVVDWTPDSKAIFFVSNRSGHFGIYKQSLDQDLAEPVLTEGYGRDPHVTPDGKNILYLGPTENGAPPGRGAEPVMSVSIKGGPPQRLFTARTLSQITCARSPSGLCVIGESIEGGKQLSVSALNPMKGRGSELFRFAVVATDDSWWVELSPDGTRVAAIRTAAGPIYILSLGGQVLQQVQVKGWNSLESFTWAADGKSLFVTAGIRNEKELLHVDLLGNARVLWQNPGASGETLAYPSPDGRHLAIQSWTTSGNMWLIENF